MKVPASISPLPATSSASARWSGRMPYFSGLKNVACMPSPNSTAISSGRLAVRKPAAPTTIRPSSHNFVARIRRDFSVRSASWPATEENST